ncbi:hypothetical protein JXO59_15735, partial [candidate division KSB1 bacterium]|nr:hypothetical protein [candidate division KSB1 bacterium]
VEEDQLRLQELTNTTRRMLTTICQSLSDPTYAGSSFFTSSNIVVKRLEKIYQFENTMMHEVSAIAEEMETLKKNELNKSIIEDHFLHIKDFIDNFNQALFERESLILGDDGV